MGQPLKPTVLKLCGPDSDRFKGKTMMYNQKLVASLKANGKILREFKDQVYIPFSCEYSILIKNLNTVRAIVNVFIDGENQTPNGLVIRAGQEVDLERSIKNNNLHEGNKFKFIERTGSVEKHRGVKLEDGIVRIEYQFEKIMPPIAWPAYEKPAPYYREKDWWSTTYGSSGQILRSAVTGIGGSTTSAQMMNVSTSSATSTYGTTKGTFSDTSKLFQNDAGITVAGSKSDQKFGVTPWFPTETEKHTIVLKLLGETADNRPVERPITVKSKPKCVTCGKQNKAKSSFCTECGTALTLFA